MRDRALLAQPFDVVRHVLTGGATQVADNVLQEGPGASAFSSWSNGVLAFWGGGIPPDTQLTWMNRQGAIVGTVGSPAGYFSAVLAPDERTVAASRYEPNEISQPNALWLIDVQRNTSTKFTFGIGSNNPAWSRDGSHVAFSSPRAGPPSLFRKLFASCRTG